MKNLIIVVAACFMFAYTSVAQESDTIKGKKEKEKKEKIQDPNDIKTIFGSGKIKHGGFLALSGNYAPDFLDKNSLLLGARGGWIMDHWFSIGLGGYGLVTPVAKDFYDDYNELQTHYFNMGYGGLYFEVAVAPKFPVHVTFPVLLGVGGCGYFEKLYDAQDSWDEYQTVDSDAFLIAEPGVHIELNVLKNMRLAFGANYRYIEDLQLQNTDPDALNGMSYNLTMKFGKF